MAGPWKKGQKPANFVGKKGRSGRKSAREEGSKIQAIREAWIKVAASVKTSDVEKVALPLALKDMATKLANPDGSKLPAPIYAGLSIQKDDSDGQAVRNAEED